MERLEKNWFPVLATVTPAIAIPRILPYSFDERSYNPNTLARPSVFVKFVFWIDKQ